MIGYGEFLDGMSVWWMFVIWCCLKKLFMCFRLLVGVDVCGVLFFVLLVVVVLVGLVGIVLGVLVLVG